MKKETVGALALLGAGLLWGTTGTAQTFAPKGFDPVVIGILRISVGGLFLLVLSIKRDIFGPIGSWPIGATLLGGVTVAAFQLFFFNGIYRTGVAVGTVVGLGSAPICAGLLAYFVRGERPGSRWYGATFLAIAGCAMLMMAKSDGQLEIETTGLFLASGAGVAYSFYALIVKDLVTQKSPLATMTVLACLGTAFLMPLLFGRDLRWLYDTKMILVALYLGLFSFAFPMVLFAYGLTATRVASAVTLTLAEPLTAGLLGFFVVGERLSPSAWIGIFMLLCGLALLTVSRRNHSIET